MLAGTFEAKSRATWADFRAEYESKVMDGKEPGTAMATRIALDHFQRIIKPARMASINSKTFSDYVAKRRREPRQSAKTDANRAAISKATVNK